MNINLSKVRESKISDVDFSNLGFCKYYTDHMFICEYEDESWNNFRIIPFQDLKLSPACTTLHYGQTIFEGLKAYKNDNDDILIFRPDKNAERFNISAQRMCMPSLPENIFLESINELLKVEKEWVPSGENNSLYIRPLMFAVDPYIGIKPADKYIFMIICGLAGGYYSEPVNVKIETKYTRAVTGGVGFAKTAANYAAALYPAVEAQKEGYHQLIWTDGKEHNYVEESGTMNLFFVIGNKLITPPLGDTVLDGVTRDSIISACSELGIDVDIRKISINEIIDTLNNGLLTEAFGAGTAATIAPIKTIGFNSKNYNLPINKETGFSQKILDYLTKIKFGIIEDKFGWVKKL
jgi:branched-chain amino acid aminotransferase|tara:strand:+ start:970 stop:2022 length:1053 start_codon:yes stop_codon:yes gene_type:complete